MRGLKNRVAIVTGAAGGIGSAICRRFLDEGAHVLAVDINADALKALAVALGADEQRLYPLAVDIADYAAVKEAYLQGLETRLTAGKPVASIASVASFFVSRVDSNVDGKLECLTSRMGLQPKQLMGQAAVANAKLAYAQFHEKFSGPRWEMLAGAGAQLQRPLWASTSTKNPHYPDLLYVDRLIGPHTVNTMPLKTLEAFLDHGVVAQTVTQGLDEARQLFADLASLGIDMEQVSNELEVEGVQKFADSYNELLQSIEQQRTELTPVQ